MLRDRVRRDEHAALEREQRGDVDDRAAALLRRSRGRRRARARARSARLTCSTRSASSALTSSTGRAPRRPPSSRGRRAARTRRRPTGSPARRRPRPPARGRARRARCGGRAPRPAPRVSAGSRRSTWTMSQPASASASAAVWPMPRVVPVTQATRPSRRKLSRTPGTGRGYHRPCRGLSPTGRSQQSNVQLALFGRTLDGRADVLPGYAISPLVIASSCHRDERERAPHRRPRDRRSPRRGSRHRSERQRRPSSQPPMRTRWLDVRRFTIPACVGPAGVRGTARGGSPGRLDRRGRAVYKTNQLDNRLVRYTWPPTPSASPSRLSPIPRGGRSSRGSRTGAATVKELSAPFAMSGPAVSKHLRVLERAGLIARGREAQWRPCRLEAAPLEEVAEWAEHYRRFWDASYERLDDYLGNLSRGSTTMTTANRIGVTGVRDAVRHRDRGHPRRRCAARAGLRLLDEARARDEVDARPRRLDDARLRDRSPAGWLLALRVAQRRRVRRWRCAASIGRSRRRSAS